MSSRSKAPGSSTLMQTSQTKICTTDLAASVSCHLSCTAPPSNGNPSAYLNLGKLTTRTVIYSSYRSCLLNTRNPADHHTKPVRQIFPS